MRIVLRNTRNGLYLRGLGCWVGRAEEARTFFNPIRALNFSALHRLEADVAAILEDGDDKIAASDFKRANLALSRPGP